MLFCSGFIAFAYLNLNDQDAWIWVTLYLYAAVLCGLVVAGRYFPGLYLLGGAVYLIYSIQRFFTADGAWDWITKHNMEGITSTMHASAPWIENTREFFGLMIAAFVMLINYAVYHKS